MVLSAGVNSLRCSTVPVVVVSTAVNDNGVATATVNSSEEGLGNIFIAVLAVNDFIPVSTLCITPTASRSKPQDGNGVG